MYVYGITQCYLPPDTSEVNTPRLNPSQTGRYSIDLPWRDGRLSWPRSLATYRDGIPARRRSPNPITSRAQCRLTTLIEANTLTTTLRRRSQHLANIGIVIAHHCSLLIAGMRFRVRVRVRVCVSACFFSFYCSFTTFVVNKCDYRSRTVSPEIRWTKVRDRDVIIDTRQQADTVCAMKQ